MAVAKEFVKVSVTFVVIEIILVPCQWQVCWCKQKLSHSMISVLMVQGSGRYVIVIKAACAMCVGGNSINDMSVGGHSGKWCA